MSNAASFRALLASRKMIVAPGAIDCITGRAIARAGFPAAYMTAPAPRQPWAIPTTA